MEWNFQAGRQDTPAVSQSKAINISLSSLHVGGGVHKRKLVKLSSPALFIGHGINYPCLDFYAEATAMDKPTLQEKGELERTETKNSAKLPLCQRS